MAGRLEAVQRYDDLRGLHRRAVVEADRAHARRVKDPGSRTKRDAWQRAMLEAERLGRLVEGAAADLDAAMWAT